MNYSYNGVWLPALPEIDETEYPYLLIRFNETNECYDLFASNVRPYYNAPHVVIPAPYNYSKYFITSNNEWKHSHIYADELENVTFDATVVVWANVDILASNGEVFLAASIPVIAGEKTWFIKKSTLVNIADKIRAKTGKTDSIPVSSLASEIDSIQTGSSGGTKPQFYDFEGTFVNGVIDLTVNESGLGLIEFIKNLNYIAAEEFGGMPATTCGISYGHIDMSYHVSGIYYANVDWGGTSATGILTFAKIPNDDGTEVIFNMPNTLQKVAFSNVNKALSAIITIDLEAKTITLSDLAHLYLNGDGVWTKLEFAQEEINFDWYFTIICHT